MRIIIKKEITILIKYFKLRDKITNLSPTKEDETQSSHLSFPNYHSMQSRSNLSANITLMYHLLQEEYNSSKVYPIFPRYPILKDMIKDIMHNPDYMEVCHEVDQA